MKRVYSYIMNIRRSFILFFRYVLLLSSEANVRSKNILVPHARHIHLSLIIDSCDNFNRSKCFFVTNSISYSMILTTMLFFLELPETSFTRSISNPEAVMRRRRQQKLERRLQQFRSKDGGPDTGGTLKIYGEALCKDVPYKTLLLSVRDSAAQVVREMLSKYGLEKVDPQLYCLVQVSTHVWVYDPIVNTNTLLCMIISIKLRKFLSKYKWILIRA